MAKIKLKKQFKEKIPGGLASGRDVASFDAESISKGIEVELEHTSDIKIATEIAMDHLAEDPKYYDKLQKMEKGVCEMKLKIKKVLKEQQDFDKGMEDVPVAMAQEMPPKDFAGEPDYEGGMARNQMYEVYEYSKQLLDMIDDEMQLPAWVQSKLTKVADYIGAVKHFIEGEMALSEQQKPDYPDLDKDGDTKEPISKAAEDAKKKDLAEKKKDFPDLTGDGKVTRADILKGRGVIDEDSLNESFIIEASCDDGEMYEMELYSEECGCGALDRALEEAEYQGRKVPLNKPMRGDVKKFKVYVKDPSTGNIKKVNFGDPNMRIKKSNPARRKSFRARHNCDNPGPKTKARYWSCRKWEE
jgi:hypothetical protein